VIDAVLSLALAILAIGGSSRSPLVIAAMLSWNSDTVPAAQTNRVEREVTAIWRRFGIDVQWRDARPGELRVTVVVKDTGTAAGSLAPLGWVNFVNNEPSAVMYASADAAWDIVQTGRTDAGRFADDPLALQQVVAARLIGRAVAHELGHYLLGSRVHSRRGLMRATLDVVDALTRGADWYDLDRGQRAMLERRLAWLAAAARARPISAIPAAPGG
jgi:hypothetical protein